MKKSKRIALGLLFSAGVSLAACSEADNPEDEEGYYGSNNYSRVYYNRMGSPYVRHHDDSFHPLPTDHPHYAAATREGQDIASGRTTYSESVTVRRGGFGSSSGLHLSSSSGS